MTAKRERLLLGLILLFAIGWDLWAIAADQRWTTSDNHIHRALDLLFTEPARWPGFLANQAPKGPVLPLLVAPLLKVTGADFFGGRLLSVICHAVLMLLAYRMAGRLLPGRQGAGLWAALLCAATPMIFGWCRLEYGEPVLACLLLIALGLLATPLETVGRAVALGLLVAAGLLTKPGFAVYLLFPALWALPRQVTSPRRALCTLLAMAVAAGPVVPWVLRNWHSIKVNYAMSGGAGTDNSPLMKLEMVLTMPGAAPLLLAAVVSMVLLWRGGLLDRWMLGYLAGAVLAPVVMFIVWFHLWSRYLMPALVVAAAVSGPGIALLLGRLGPRGRKLGAAVTAAALVASVLWFNLARPEYEEPREIRSGLLTADQRPRRGLRMALRELRRQRVNRALLAYDSGTAMDRWEGLDALLRFWRVPLKELSVKRMRVLLEAHQEVWALLISSHPLDEMARSESLPALHSLHADDPGYRARYRDALWLVMYPHKEVMVHHVDPDGIRYNLMKLGPPPRGSIVP